MFVGRIALVAALSALAIPASAQAAFPGHNGKIVFERSPAPSGGCDSAIYAVGSDGSGLANLNTGGPSDGGSLPVWSPDGQRIALVTHEPCTSSEIWVEDQSGGNRTQLTNNSFFD